LDIIPDDKVISKPSKSWRVCRIRLASSLLPRM
jgi:hypothetical protein